MAQQQLSLFAETCSETAFDVPTEDELWDLYIAGELTLDEWADVMNYLYPLTPEALDQLSPRRTSTNEGG